MPTADPPTVSVVVVSHNTAALLRDCLAAIAAEDSRSVAQVVVVDNGSTDGSPEMVRRLFPDSRLIENRHNLGFAAANNQGVAAASGEEVLLLNSDALVERGAIGTLRAALRAQARPGLVAPRLLNADGSVQRSAFRFPTPWQLFLEQTSLAPRLAVARRVEDSPYQPVDWLVGACVLGRRDLLRELGPFDPAFFMYGEDVDLCLRLRRLEREIWLVPTARVTHLGGGSSNRYADRRVLWWTQSTYRLYRKHHDSASLRRAAAVIRGLALLKLLRAALGLIAARTPGRADERRRRAEELRIWRAVLGLAPGRGAVLDPRASGRSVVSA